MIGASSATTSSPVRERILTGDRPTGPLHLGHDVGSLWNQTALQHQHEQTILIADLKALTDNAGRAADVRRSIREVVLDYLAAGIDPAVSTERAQPHSYPAMNGAGA